MPREEGIHANQPDVYCLHFDVYLTLSGNVAANILHDYFWDRDIPTLRFGGREARMALETRLEQWKKYLRPKNDRQGSENLARFEKWSTFEREIKALEESGDLIGVRHYLNTKVLAQAEQEGLTVLRPNPKHNSRGAGHELPVMREFKSLHDIMQEVRKSVHRFLCHMADTHKKLPIVCTNDGAGSNKLLHFSAKSFSQSNKPRFASVLTDESANCAKTSALIPLQHGPERVVKVGDERQLPAVVKSENAKKLGLDVSFFEELTKDEDNVVLQLSDQRRMHSSIAAFPNTQFYDEHIKNAVHDSDRPVIQGWDWPVYDDGEDWFRVAFVDVDTADSTLEFKEMKQANSHSRSNPVEAKFVTHIVESLLKCNSKQISAESGSILTAERVGILTPYADQKRALNQEWDKRIDDRLEAFDKRKREEESAQPPSDGNSDEDKLFRTAGSRKKKGREHENTVTGETRREIEDLSQVKIDTVDGFQGKEKDLIVISLTRTEDIGFLTSAQRINVALSRARRGLIVVGSGKILQGALNDKTNKTDEARTFIWKAWHKFVSENTAIYQVQDALDMCAKIESGNILDLPRKLERNFNESAGSSENGEEEKVAPQRICKRSYKYERAVDLTEIQRNTGRMGAVEKDGAVREGFRVATPEEMTKVTHAIVDGAQLLHYATGKDWKTKTNESDLAFDPQYLLDCVNAIKEDCPKAKISLVVLRAKIERMQVSHWGIYEGLEAAAEFVEAESNIANNADIICIKMAQRFLKLKDNPIIVTNDQFRDHAMVYKDFPFHTTLVTFTLSTAGCFLHPRLLPAAITNAEDIDRERLRAALLKRKELVSQVQTGNTRQVVGGFVSTGSCNIMKKGRVDDNGVEMYAFFCGSLGDDVQVVRGVWS